MTVPVRAPESYQQWLELLQYLQEHPGDSAACSLVSQGAVAVSSSEAFKVRLSETVSIMLSYHCTRFLKQLDAALENGEPDMAPLLAQRFRRSIQRCLIYRDMPFLEPEFTEKLDTGYKAQLCGFWETVLKQLKVMIRENDNPVLEDLIRELRRIHIL